MDPERGELEAVDTSKDNGVIAGSKGNGIDWYGGERGPEFNMGWLNGNGSRCWSMGIVSTSSSPGNIKSREGWGKRVVA